MRLVVVVRTPDDVCLVESTLDDGSSVRTAAQDAVRRAGGDRRPDVWAIDLSGDPLVLGCRVSVGMRGAAPAGSSAPGSAADEVRIGFRPMTRADFPDVVAWQARPHVARWWSSEASTVEGAEAHYGSALDGTDPTRMWVLEVNGRSVGMLQDYRVGDHPDWAVLTARPDAVGLDYLIGDPARVDRGIGTRALWTFLRDVVAPGYPDATEFFASPDHRNERSLRVLDKLGFVRGLWFDEPQSDGTVATLVGCTFEVRRILGAPAVTDR
jgi:RimJ/RimL family protein N-acetyltransferase